MTTRQTKKIEDILNAAHLDYAKALNIHSFFKVSNRTISEDLVQTTFMKTWIYLAKGGKIDLMRSFLYHILNDLIVDEYRKRKTISLDSLIENGFMPSTNNTESFFNFLDGKKALLLIKALPPPYQQVMRLRYVQDLSVKEISLITGQSRNTVAVRLHRGLKKIKLLYID